MGLLQKNRNVKSAVMSNYSSEAASITPPMYWGNSVEARLDLDGLTGPDSRQRQEHAAVAGAWRHPVDFKRKSSHTRRRILDRLRHWQSPLRRRSLGKQVDGAARWCRQVNNDRRPRRAVFAPHRSDRKRSALPQSLFLRHARFCCGKRCILRRWPPGKGQLHLAFHGEAQLFANRIVELEAQHDRLFGIRRNDTQRKNHIVDITNRDPAGHSTSTDFTFCDWPKSNCGGTPESPG